jgi:hypothetical protein
LDTNFQVPLELTNLIFSNPYPAPMTMTNTDLNNVSRAAFPGPDAHLVGSNNLAPDAPRRRTYTSEERQARRAAMQAERAREEGFDVAALPALHLGNPHRALNF